MKFYYIEQKITDIKFSNFLKLENFSEISFKRSNFKKIIIDSIPEKLDVFPINEDELYSIKDDSKAIFWCSSIIFTNQEIQNQFIKKLTNAFFPMLFGSRESYIFKGNLSQLKSILNNEQEKDILNLNKELHLKSVLSISDFKNIISENSHTRHFNEIISHNDKFIKKSFEIEKLESEFLFLKNIPETLKEYYVQVYDFNKNDKSASYSMQKLSGVDLSINFINGSFDSKDIANILNLLKEYFINLKKLTGNKDLNNLSFITNKNNKRHEDLKQWEGYNNLDNFINRHTVFSGIDDLYKSSNRSLEKKRKLLNNSGSYFSHGDLCFSNMIFSETENKITFIDPRGGKEDEVFRTPYYDLAKISHSLLGGYDHIINNISMIEFDHDMKAYLNLNGALNHDGEKKFTAFIESLGYDLNLVRQVEASLFISMLPLHTDDIRKVFMLALRASELLSDKSRGSK